MTNVESQNILLECKDLLVGYGKALPSMKFPFDFSLASGSVVALMGENGCGKSSLLKTFAGLLAPVAGEVSLEGKSLTEWAPRERAQKISLVRMSSAVPPRMSVSEFVRLGRSPYSGIFDSRTEEDNRIVENSMALLDVANFANRPIAELSDGERSRVFLAEAVAQQVKILLLDEPNAFLDIPRSHALFRLLKKIAVERQMGIVVSTHSVEYAERYCDKIMVVNGGTVKVASAADARKNGLLDWTEICDAL
ncbi:ABC transporter ATP-binding protein [Fibrobacter succinogenes]|uniref:Iron complex transport system ATP-binding protein n=1 Tax=Fibrobacter succinogenes TaxID=833 RepID=A0A380RXN3_FIBSU|nr:ABC transporter ATP-binding protein [Fibrobacter succinogenes]PWJ37490.1 iron complex transport system ATP-binding protein/cobalt-precorrin-5B (C1)-methyltransferase [Fibrobacter succinogenes subsp. elongatus]SUQ19737.1 iron complex transport system ATP-binding protein [Fibrobacter succinogenes]